MTAPYNPKANFRQCHEPWSEIPRTHTAAPIIVSSTVQPMLIQKPARAFQRAGYASPSLTPLGSPGRRLRARVSSTVAPLGTTRIMIRGRVILQTRLPNRQGSSCCQHDISVYLPLLQPPFRRFPLVGTITLPAVRLREFRGVASLPSRFPGNAYHQDILLTSELTSARNFLPGLHPRRCASAMTPAPRTVPFVPALSNVICDSLGWSD